MSVRTFRTSTSGAVNCGPWKALELILDAESALARLKDGNRAFVAAAGDQTGGYRLPAGKPQLDHHPPAVVLACSDARVPTELIFNQGLGDLFVIRVAGNVATETQIASVEYAVAQLDVRLVVVLGHRGCGAVTAAYDATSAASPETTEPLAHLVARIQPAIDRLQANEGQRVTDRAEIIQRAVWHNVDVQREQLLAGSTLLGSEVAEGRVRIVGACYDTGRGHVEFDT